MGGEVGEGCRRDAIEDLGIQSIQRQPQSGTWDGEEGREALSWGRVATKGPGPGKADAKA